jgi:hypothetical protein
MADCAHTNQTEHTTDGTITDVNPATGNTEVYRTYLLRYKKCDDCGATTGTQGPTYGAPNW